jgi:hypothetical protein
VKWTPYHHWMWFWCWLCYRLYLALPAAMNLNTRYSRICLWLLGYAGCYAYGTRENFPWCRFFFESDEACRAAWAKHLNEASAAP